MKKSAAFLSFILFLFYFPSISAQENETDYFYKSVPIVKILLHSAGYKIVYRKGNMELDNFYVPSIWFVAGGKAEIIYGSDRSYPYCSIFFREGKFDFIRIFVREDMADPTWGILKARVDTKKNFEIEEINLEF